MYESIRFGRTARVAALFAILLAVAVAGPASTSVWASEVGAGATAGQRIDLNTADAKSLTGVPGIGETMARRIVEWRDEHGPFRQVEDLLKVKGVGEKTFEKLRPYFTVRPAGGVR